jgi:hypothetical protein
VLFRFHPFVYDDRPLYFGREPIHRFAAPNREYGTLYAGSDAHVAFVETFGRDVSEQFVTLGEIERACLTHVQVLSGIRLADLTGARLRTLGADARLTTGNYELTHVWGLALWDHPDHVDGLVWHSRFDDERLVIGLFDRASTKVGWACQGSLALPWQLTLLGDILDTYHFGI